MGGLLVVLAFNPTVIEGQGNSLDAPAFGQFDLGSFDGLLGLVRLISGQDKMRLGVVAGGSGYSAQELGPYVEVGTGCVSCDG